MNNKQRSFKKEFLTINDGLEEVIKLSGSFNQAFGQVEFIKLFKKLEELYEIFEQNYKDREDYYVPDFCFKNLIGFTLKNFLTKR